MCAVKVNHKCDRLQSAVTKICLAPHRLMSAEQYLCPVVQGSNLTASLAVTSTTVPRYVCTSRCGEGGGAASNEHAGTPTAINCENQFLPTLIFSFFPIGQFLLFYLQVTYAFFGHIPPPLESFSESLNISYYRSPVSSFPLFIFFYTFGEIFYFSLVSRVFVTAWVSIYDGYFTSSSDNSNI